MNCKGAFCVMTGPQKCFLVHLFVFTVSFGIAEKVLN